MNVINECETLSAQLAASDANFLVAFNAVKADLLLTARRQVRFATYPLFLFIHPFLVI